MSHISKLDRFHYHEAVDRLAMVNAIIDDHIFQHPVVKSFGKLKEEVETAATALFSAYQMAGHLGHIIDELSPILEAVANDYQLDKTHPEYCGFLNTAPIDEWSADAVNALEFLITKEPDLFFALLDKYNLDVESKPNLVEIVFIKTR